MTRKKLLTRQRAEVALRAGPPSIRWGISFWGYTDIEDAAAEALGRHRGRLRLPDLESLSDTAAAALASQRGHLHLHGVRQISDQGLLALSSRIRQIHWPAILTKRLKQLLRATGPQGQEKAPPQWKDGTLALEPIGSQATWQTQSQLSKKHSIPSSLFKWFVSLLPREHRRRVDKGRFLVDEMSDVAAELLIGYRPFFEAVRARQSAGRTSQSAAALQAALGADPNLGKIRRLLLTDDPGAFLLAIGLLEQLGLGDQGWATILSRNRLNFVCSRMGGREVHALLEAAADRPLFRTHLLSTYKACHLRLPSGQDDLSEKAAQTLGCYEGPLDLHKVKTLGQASARALSRHSGELNLSGLTDLDADTARELARHQGILRPDGLTHLTPGAARALAGHRGELNLGGLGHIDGDVAQALSKHTGGLSLSGLTALDNASAKALSLYRGRLWLNRLSGLSEAAAAAFARHQGELMLHGVKHLSAAAAETLARHQGEVSLDEPAKTNLAETVQRLALGDAPISSPKLEDPGCSTKKIAPRLQTDAGSGRRLRRPRPTSPRG